MSQKPMEILYEEILRVIAGGFRNRGRRIPAMVVSDYAITPREVSGLRFPRAQVATVLMDPDQRHALAGLLPVEIDAVNARDRHSVLS